MAAQLPQKLTDQMRRAGLPVNGQHPFKPKIVKNSIGREIIEKRAVSKGPKIGKRGYVDEQNRIWIRDRAHGHVPDHWDVQINNGDDYFRVDDNGNEIP